jgi:glycosyltransferase involved in cell wall biosynthesis
MRIGFDVSQTGRFKTGCGYFADALARHLLSAGSDHSYILYPTFGAGYWDRDWASGTLAMPDHPNVTRGLGHARLDQLEGFWLDPPADAEEQLGAPDVIHSNNFFCPTNLNRARLVYTLHDLIFATHPDWTTEANWRVCFDGVFNASLYADHIVAVSEFTRRQFLETFPHFPEARISVVYEASRLEGPHGAPAPRGVAHLMSGQFWLASGDTTTRKNLPRLLEAYASLRASGDTAYPLVLYGGPTNDSRERTRDVPVQRLGYVDDATLQWLYENCFAFCYPSLFEGFGLPVVEAMRLGAAVLTSNVTSLPEVVGDSALLVDPTSLDDVHAGLRRLALDEAERTRLRRAAIDRASRFSWRQAASDVLDIYDGVVNGYPHSVERMSVGR